MAEEIQEINQSELLSAKSGNLVTKDVPATLKEYAAKKGIKLDQLDFRLVNHQVYFKTYRMTEFEKLSPHLAQLYQNDREELLKQKVDMLQLCEIEPIHKPGKKAIELDYDIQSDDYFSHPYLMIKPTSVIDYKRYPAKVLFQRLLYEVNKIKAYHGILIGLFCDVMQDQLKSFVRNLYKGMSLKEETAIVLFEGIEPTGNVQSDLIHHYKARHDTPQRLYEAAPGDLLVEYVKPKMGESGFLATGKFVSGEFMNKVGSPTFSVDAESVDRQEDEDAIRYISRKNGYVKFTPGRLSVETVYKVSDVSRVEETISQHEANAIEVVVDDADETRDGLGEGVQLVSNKVRISGFTGKGSMIKAKTVKVDGLTHATSSIFAQEAEINRHKGTVRGSKVKIKSLEGGRIYATEAEVEYMVGGVIFAEKVTIGTMKGHGKIYASKKIEVERIEGEDNLLSIDCGKIATLEGRRNYLREKLEGLKKDLFDAMKKRGGEEETKAVREQIKKMKWEVAEATCEPMQAKIKINTVISGINIIRFVTEKPQRVLEYRTTHSMLYDTFHLEQEGDRLWLRPGDVSVEV